VKEKLKVVERRGEVRGAEEGRALNKRNRREDEKKKVLKTTYGREEGLLRLVLEI